jgi:hypothetical protein
LFWIWKKPCSVDTDVEDGIRDNVRNVWCDITTQTPSGDVTRTGLDRW